LIRRRTFRQRINALLPGAAGEERGSTVLETAISFTFLSVLIFGLFETCLAVYAYHFLGNAAHEGARYAIVRGSTWNISCDGSGKAGTGYASSQCTASTSDIANYIVHRSYPGILLTTSNICVQYRGPVPGSATGTCNAANSISGDNAKGDIVQITVNYPFTFNLPGFRKSITMSSTSQMVIAE
jgi:Flp pilus assembly protein TadG